MIRGLYTSAIGMAGQMKRMDTVANNLANADSPGFKRDVVVTQSFTDVLMQRVREYELRGFNTTNITGPASLGIIVSSVHRDFSAGSLQPTGSPLDLAISGPGFFEIAFADPISGEVIPMFSRSGSFTLSEGGMLTTMGGHAVVNTSGEPIIIPTGEIAIHEGGGISVNGAFVDTIRIVDFEDPATLRAFGENLYATTDESVEAPFAGRLIQGYIETSNVNIVREMVEMIALSRAYEANARMVSIADQTLAQAVNEIARR
ncbi:MAG: flagellar hook-basal body protein [Clostridiales bacterium]|nr:flagellar hook-basal body protein [Clostridiales bacterium]